MFRQWLENITFSIRYAIDPSKFSSDALADRQSTFPLSPFGSKISSQRVIPIFNGCTRDIPLRSTDQLTNSTVGHKDPVYG